MKKLILTIQILGSIICFKGKPNDTNSGLSSNWNHSYSNPNDYQHSLVRKSRDIERSKSRTELMESNMYQAEFGVAPYVSKIQGTVSEEIETKYFDQLVDHVGSRTFKQRYYVNRRYYVKGGPVFLYLGGERAAMPQKADQGIIKTLAKLHQGLIYVLEHRYYGVSHPFQNLTAETLKYLSSDYALKDISNFIKTVEGYPSQEPTIRKWFLIGGSYSGMLAAWARQRYPNLVFGALASSAPIQAKADFVEYDMGVRQALGELCSKRVYKIIQEIDHLYKANYPRFLELKSMFGCHEVGNDALFLSILSDALSSTVQSDIRAKNGEYVYCEKETISLNEFIEITGEVFQKFSKSCLDFSQINSLSSTTIDENSMYRQWVYQCCTEFGFWQGVHPKNPMRSSLLTSEWYQNFMCSSDFFTTKLGPAQVEAVNKQYLGKAYNANRTIFTNSLDDPWSKLSITDIALSQPDRPVISISGSNHVSVIKEPRDWDPNDLKLARKIVCFVFSNWIDDSLNYAKSFHELMSKLATYSYDISSNTIR